MENGYTSEMLFPLHVQRPFFSLSRSLDGSLLFVAENVACDL